MKKALFLLFLCINLMAYAQNSPQFPTAADAPGLEFAFELHVKIDGAFGVGPTSHGERFVIPITGGACMSQKYSITPFPRIRN